MRLSGGQFILQHLKQKKVPYILGIPGHGILGLFDAIRQADKDGVIRYIQVKHEQTATHMADGYYRVAGSPLAVFTSIGPGALNTAIGLGTAYVDSTAFLQFSGDTHVHMKGVGVLQEIERYQDSYFIRAMEPLSKRAWRVEAVGQLPRLMRRAFGQMEAGRPGPVVMALPMDVQADTLDYTPEPDSGDTPPPRPAGDEALVQKAARLMAGARRPVIMAGGGMLRSRAFEALQKLAEAWGAAVVTTMAGKSAFPENHPLSGCHTGTKATPIGLELTRNADVILALGCRFADETTCSYRKGEAFSFPETKLIHVDLDAAELGKNYPCNVGIQGDVGLVLAQLLQAYSPLAPEGFDYRSAPYTAEIARLRAEWDATLAKAREQKFEKITISQLIAELGQCLPGDTIITTSSGNTQAQLFQEYRFKTPGCHLTSGGFSTMGWAFPAAMGAKLASPAQPVVALLGDGDFMMVMQELSTLAQYNIPVVVVLANNAGWMAIKDLQSGMLGQEYTFGNDWTREGEDYNPDFVKIAEAFGVAAQRISTAAEVAPALDKALQSGAPAFIEVEVHREFPESGGDAYGWWDVPMPEYLPRQKAMYDEGRREEQV